MPALFAYLIAVGLLLGGGYGTLSWLAAPEPVKVVAKTIPKPSPHYEASREASSSEAASSAASSASINDSDHAASEATAQAPSPQPKTGVAASEQAEASGPAQDQQSRSAEVPAVAVKQHAEATPADDAAQEARQATQNVPPVSPIKQQTAVSTAPATAAKPVKRLHLRQASSRLEKPAEKHALALMTLRTIEFPDGRRVAQLVPYRGSERALAFQPEE
jgi:hypothetical protein